jgi:hypothetical protein
VVSSPRDRKPDLTYAAPVAWIDLAADEDDGTPCEIWPCNDCLPWHIEVIQEDGNVYIREWHAVDCPLFQDLLKNQA